MHKSMLLTALLLISTMITSDHHSLIELSKPQTKTEITLAETQITSVLPVHQPTRQELLQPLMTEMAREAEEMLPFDEPRHEFGEQLDGKLRGEWAKAYFHHEPKYVFNGDTYYTMYYGKPHVPQVCADFIVDTIDRTAGTWYSASLKYPHKVEGRFNFRKLSTSEGYDVRRVPDLLELFHKYPDSFQFVFEGTSMMNTSQTHKMQVWMKQLGVQLGDIIIIRGRAPWDHGKEIHWHSLFVTGFNDEGEVQLVTGNPVYPVERTLKIEGNRAPKRRIVEIIRMSDAFLGMLTGLAPPM